MKPLNHWTTGEIIEIIKRVDKKTWSVIGSTSVISLLVLVFFIIPAWIERPMLGAIF